MAITPQAGYMVDPNNSNGVVKIGSVNAGTGLAYGMATAVPANIVTGTPASISNPNANYNAGVIPTISAPAVTQPAPQISTPAVPDATPQTAPQTQQNATATTQASTTPTTQTQQPALTLPQNGSVVDLLNAAGQDSSFAARQQLAQQYGIQGYTGTAQQNTDLAKKYTDAFNANKGAATPQSGAQASSALDSYFQENKQTQQVDPQQNFFDQTGSMNPVVSSLYQQANQLLSTQATAQTFTQQYQDLVQSTGLQGLETQKMNINNIMSGTEDDIRTEIQKAGGFATESQVQALTAARNKTLLVQANSLDQQIQTQQDYINQIMQFSEADRTAVTNQVNAETGLADHIQTMQTNMDNASKDNYQKIVDTVGYSGLAAMVAGNPQEETAVEKSLGLASGALTNPTFLHTQDTKNAGQVYGSASTGYFTYNSLTGQATPINAGGTGGSDGGSSAPATSTPYTLKAGDDPYNIAKANGTDMAGLQALNPTITNWNNLPVGAKINLPLAGGALSTDPIVDGWAQGILNGSVTGVQSVPKQYQAAVNAALNTPGQNGYAPLAVSRFTRGANAIVANYINLPQYQLTSNGLPYLQRIDAAIKNPGSVSDQDLLDSLTKLNTSGNAISDAQVKLITDGKSFADMASTFENKFQTGGVLSANQRTQIQKIANAIYDNYKTGYQPVYDQATAQLKASGIPEAFWTIPDLNKLNTQTAGSSSSSSSIADLRTKYGY